MKHDLGARAPALVQVLERTRPLGERPLLDPGEVAERAALQRRDRRPQVGRRVSIGAEKRDLGERELAHVDLARPVLESDVHDHAAGLHCGKRGVARRLGPDRIDHQVGGVVGHRLLRERIERTASGVLLERRAAQRIGLGDAHRAAAVVAGEQCREHADRAAADDEQRALPQRPMQRPH